MYKMYRNEAIDLNKKIGRNKLVIYSGIYMVYAETSIIRNLGNFFERLL
jgi:hypothetical protein